MPVPVPAGGAASVAWGAAVADLLNTLEGIINQQQTRAAAYLRAGATQSLTGSTWTSLLLSVEDFDDDPDGVGGHSTSVNTSRYTARYAGWYRVGGGVGFASNATGNRACRWSVNGTLVDGSPTIMAAVNGLASVAPSRSILIFLNVGDYLEIQGYQSSGGALLTTIVGGDTTSVSVSWERPAS